MNKLIQLIYVSAAVKLFSELELFDLLQLSRDANEKYGVTGCLLYQEGNFMQVLEGSKIDVERLFANISLDSSHRGIILLLKEPIGQRSFADWSMGFKSSNEPNIRGFFDLLLSFHEDCLVAGKAKTLLLSFTAR